MWRACEVLASIPWIAGYGATLGQVGAGEGVDASAQPVATALVPRVQHVHHLVTVHRQGAAVRLAGDVEVDADVEGVAGRQHAIGQIPLETVEGWWGRRRGGIVSFLRVTLRSHWHLDATPTVIVDSVVKTDGSRAVLQHPVGFFLSAGLQRDASVLAVDASFDLFSQSQRGQEWAKRRRSSGRNSDLITSSCDDWNVVRNICFSTWIGYKLIDYDLKTN